MKRFFILAVTILSVNALAQETESISSIRFNWNGEHADMGIIKTSANKFKGIGFKFNDVEQVRFSADGNVLVNGKVESKVVKVTKTPTADFVFANDYKLRSLEDTEKFIKENSHLPEIASAKEMTKEGVNIGEFQIQLLQKIEELTLYSIEQNKKIAALEQCINEFTKQ